MYDEGRPLWINWIRRVSSKSHQEQLFYCTLCWWRRSIAAMTMKKKETIKLKRKKNSLERSADSWTIRKAQAHRSCNWCRLLILKESAKIGWWCMCHWVRRHRNMMEWRCCDVFVALSTASWTYCTCRNPLRLRRACAFVLSEFDSASLAYTVRNSAYMPAC